MPTTAGRARAAGFSGHLAAVWSKGFPRHPLSGPQPAHRSTSTMRSPPIIQQAPCLPAEHCSGHPRQPARRGHSSSHGRRPALRAAYGHPAKAPRLLACFSQSPAHGCIGAARRIIRACPTCRRCADVGEPSEFGPVRRGAVRGVAHPLGGRAPGGLPAGAPAEAEDFFLGLPAREQAELISHLPPAERRPWVRPLPLDDLAGPVQTVQPKQQVHRRAPCGKHELSATAAFVLRLR